MFKVMIVDDMDIVRREIKRLKIWGEKSGFIVSDEAKNGFEALAKIQKNSVDLVITDLKMPKIDGLELLRNLVEKELCSCVVLLSDFSEFSYVRQGLVLGAFDYMTKPVNEEELKKLLQRAGEYILSKRKQRDRVRKLEETLDERVEVFFPAADVKLLIELIQGGDMKAVEVADRMVDITGANLNHDPMKVESVLKNGMLEISKGVFESCPWLDKFVDQGELNNIDFSACNEFHAVKAAFVGSVQRTVVWLNKLQYGALDRGIVRQVCSFVLENIDGELSLKNVADRLFLNKTYVSEIFKQKTGMSFVEYLTFVKMERAKMLITEENLKTYEIAERLGFKDVEYFSRLFKKSTGMSPTEFRQMNIKNL